MTPTELTNQPIKAIDPDSVWPIGKKPAFFTCFVIFMLGLMDIVDRQILATLFPFIKAEWALSDTELGALMSIVNISIAILVVPSAYFIDKWSRKKMMALMGVVWSVATGLCAFTTSFMQLFLTRFLVGFGEAGYNPAAQALLAASFPTRLRTSAIAMAQFGMILGTPIGLVIGGYIGTHWGWRHAFGVVAIPGILIALLALFIKDYKTPPAEKAEEEDGKKKKQVPYWEIILQMFKTPSLLCVYLGATCFLFYSSATQSWVPSYFIREAGMSVQKASNITALTMLSLFVAILVLPPFIDLMRRRWKAASAYWLAFATLFGTLLMFIAYTCLTPGGIMQICFLLLANVFWGTIAIVGPTIVIDITHPSHRATAISLLIMCQNILGMSLGPIIAGIVSDKFDLATSLVVLLITPFIAGLSYVVCSFTFNKDAAKVANKNIQFV